ncbi:MAG: hypothetical protein IKN82_07865 [Treponema sp.]|nr:hypothetical protein [Treponema sp.]
MEKAKKNILAVVGFWFLFSAFFLGYRVSYFLGNFFPTVLFKALCSSCFVALGLFNYCRTGQKSSAFKKYSVKIILGLVFSLAADVIIKLSLVFGILAFLLAQVSYFLAFLEFKKVSLRYVLLVVFVTAAILLFEWFSPWFELKKLLVPLCVYALVDVGSALKSIDALRLKDRFSRVVFFASVMFLISDLSLQLSIREICSLSWLGDQAANNFSNILYYAAQLLFAHSLCKDFFASGTLEGQKAAC